MAPKVKFQREEIVAAALEAVREKGIDAVTAREVAQRLGVSTRPIFTWYRTMDQLRRDVFAMAMERYRAYIESGLAEPIPFQGVWRQYLRFAQQEPELYKLLFLTPPDGAMGGAMEALTFSQALARPSIMATYRMDQQAAQLCHPHRHGQLPLLPGGDIGRGRGAEPVRLQGLQGGPGPGGGDLRQGRRFPPAGNGMRRSPSYGGRVR